MKELFTATSKNKTGRTLFYIFEITALVVGVLMLIFAIYESALYGGIDGFMVFLRDLASIAFDVLVLYGIGKIIDLKMAKKDAKEQKEENKPQE